MTDYNQNPFASTHSLDTNPFDDPPQQSASAASAEAARLEEIRRREQDLERREAELNNKADHIRRHGRNNFPPFFPLIFHSIQDEIPEASRRIVKHIYQLWLFLLGTLIVNVVACLIFISILSFLLWYRPIYNGYMKEQALYFCKLLFSLYMIIGIPGTGSAGLIQTIRLFSDHHWVAAVFALITTIGWTVQGVGNAYFYREIYTYHTAAGHTMEKAKTELASHGAKAYFTRG
ncbi:scamp family-domain-containing protein [Flammula alnicola]|nr:scamp family-domain-containing protein [Flammula alnicola]